MQHLFSLVAVVLLLVVAASAQTAGDSLKPDSEGGQTEYTAHRNGNLAARLEGGRVTGARTGAKLNGEARVRAPQVIRVGPSTTYLKPGLSTDDVVRLLGHPASVSERQEGDSRLATYIFARGEGRVIVAEFKNGSLINSRAEIRGAITAAAPIN